MIVHFSFFLDLPKLQTISFDGDNVLEGDNRDIRKTIINSHESYDNTLIMKGIINRVVLYWIIG